MQQLLRLRKTQRELSVALTWVSAEEPEQLVDHAGYHRTRPEDGTKQWRREAVLIRSHARVPLRRLAAFADAHVERVTVDDRLLPETKAEVAVASESGGAPAVVPQSRARVRGDG